MIWIENKINLKDSTEDSTGIGLKNLESRYKLITGQSIQIYNDDQIFKVGLPLFN